MVAARNYSSTARRTTLSGTITSGATAFDVAEVTGFPAAPFVLVLDRGLATEEAVLVTALGGLTCTATRGFDGTSAVAHTVGAEVAHMMVGADLAEAGVHVGGLINVHGVTSNVVGINDVQSMDGKTFLSVSGSGIPLTVKQAVAQSGTILSIKNSAGAQLAGWQTTGRINAPGVDGMNSITVTADVAATTPITTRGAASQTANLLLVMNSAGASLAWVTAAGRWQGPGGDFTANIDASIPVVTKGFSPTQSGNLFEARSSADVTLAAVTPTGRVTAVGLDTTAQNNLVAGAVGVTPLVAKASATPSVDLVQWKDSAGVTQGRVTQQFQNYHGSNNPVPYATAAGSAAVTVTAGVGSQLVTFPGGGTRFATAPFVFVNINASGAAANKLIARAISTTTTTFTISVITGDASTAANTTVTVEWFAVTMLPAVTAG